MARDLELGEEGVGAPSILQVGSNQGLGNRDLAGYDRSIGLE